MTSSCVAFLLLPFASAYLAMYKSYVSFFTGICNTYCGSCIDDYPYLIYKYYIDVNKCL